MHRHPMVLVAVGLLLAMAASSCAQLATQESDELERWAAAVKAVVELASFLPFNQIHQIFLDQLAETIGVVLNMIQANMRTEELLIQSQKLTQELQSQSQELQTQQEELRRTNAELEAQARTLKASEEALRDQQEELQQVNEELGTTTAVITHNAAIAGMANSPLSTIASRSASVAVMSRTSTRRGRASPSG